MKKILFYIIIYIPFLLGIILFSLSIVNLFSSLCLFFGGYIAIKNTFDYRRVEKNRNYLNKTNYYHKNNIQEVAPGKIKSRKRERVRIRKK